MDRIMDSVSRVQVPNAILLGEVSRLLDDGKDVILMTKGCSMLPFIRGERDSVNLRKLDVLEVGDIVLARVKEDVYVLHRVFSVDGDAVTLMGDGNLKGKERCRRADICGTAIEILREGGKVVDCRGRKALALARIWRFLLPLRRYMLAVYRRL